MMGCRDIVRETTPPDITSGTSIASRLTQSIEPETVVAHGTATATGETTPIIGSDHLLMTDPKGFLMAHVPADTFQAGFTLDQAKVLCNGIPDVWAECNPSLLIKHSPFRMQTISRDYWIDVYEVTNEQYQACVDAGTCTPPNANWIQLHDNYYLDPDFSHYPVVHVVFEQAEKFCSSWRGGHLPTEDEWEYSARGADGRLWPWGNDITDPDTLANVMTVDAAAGGIGKSPAEVGSFKRDVSPFGLFDMAGNVSEWVDHTHSEIPEHAPSIKDPVGIFRGGFSDYVFFAASTAYRNVWTLSDEAPFLGFRCAQYAN